MWERVEEVGDGVGVEVQDGVGGGGGCDGVASVLRRGSVLTHGVFGCAARLRLC